MTRRRVLCGLLLASAALVCFAGWRLIASVPRQVTLAKFEQVKKGMSRKEVIRTVGGPPGDYLSDGRLSWFAHNDGHRSFWFCDEAELQVAFDDTRMATNVEIGVPPRERLVIAPTLLERILRRLGL
jgi:hypothetical protein